MLLPSGLCCQSGYCNRTGALWASTKTRNFMGKINIACAIRSKVHKSTDFGLVRRKRSDHALAREPLRVRGWGAA